MTRRYARTSAEAHAVCRRASCVHPTVCKHFAVDHGPLVELGARLDARCLSPAAILAWAISMRIVATVTLPARDITKMALGGADLRTAFVTRWLNALRSSDRALSVFFS